MPAGIRPPNCVGKKGRSGRKCYRDEQLRIEVIENAWLKKKKRMNDSDALQIVLKDMTERTDIKLTIPKPIDDILEEKQRQIPERISSFNYKGKTNALSENNRLPENKEDEGKNTYLPGGYRSIQDSGDSALLNSNGSIRQEPDPDQHSE